MSVQSQKLKLEEEDASRLKLGPDFSEANCLMNSEVEFLLKRVKERSEQDDELNEMPMQTLKTLAYVTRFSHFRKNKEQIKEVRNTLSRFHLHEFEIATLANLCPESSDEARTLIPTLAEKFDDDDQLENTLNELKSYADQF